MGTHSIALRPITISAKKLVVWREVLFNDAVVEAVGFSFTTFAFLPTIVVYMVYLEEYTIAFTTAGAFVAIGIVNLIFIIMMLS